jgi:hypothetical protein
MNKTEDVDDGSAGGVYFNDGCVRATNYVYLSAKLKGVDPDEYEFSRTFTCRGSGAQASWGHRDFPGADLVSVCHFSNASFSDMEGWNGARLVALAANGQVFFSAKGIPPQPETISDVESIGSASQVRQIGERLYVCGMQGQVYRRDQGGWVHIDAGILDRKISASALHLNSIHGTSDRDIYVVGLGGRILHFDGARWDELDSPTNVHLERVHCVSPSEAYVCGNKGTFFKLSKGVFTDHSIRVEDHFWGLTSFQGKVYLATLKGLYAFDGKRVQPVDTQLKPPIDGYRLDSCEDQLWSFGVDDLAFFDGKKWKRVKHPDNP